MKYTIRLLALCALALALVAGPGIAQAATGGKQATKSQRVAAKKKQAARPTAQVTRCPDCSCRRSSSVTGWR